MPTYPYVCSACNHSFEEFQPITAKPIRTCPRCKRRRVKRVIHGGAGLIFKGSGFYITDYRSKSYQEAVKKESDKPSAGKSETPAAKDKKEKK